MKIARFFRRWAATCLVSLFALNSYAGTTPGSYTNYRFAPTVTALESVDFGITPEVEPGVRANVYWSNQFKLGNGTVAYTGMQRHSSEGGLFLFSVWDGTDAKVGSSGSYCITFQEDGTGKSCRMKYNWQAGHTYQFHLAHEGDQWFGVTVNDLTAGTSFKLGSIRTQATSISTTGMVNWTEYWEWNWPESNCYNQPYTRTEFLLPIGNNGATVAAVASTKVSTPCASRVDLTSVGSVHSDAIGNTPRGVIKQQPDLCIDAHTYRSGDPATGYYCHGLDNQAWVHGADKTIRTRSNLCLAAYNHGTTPGTKVVVWSCGPSDQKNQQWTLAGSELRNGLSGLCLNGTVAGEQLTLQKCDQGWVEPMP